MHTLCVCVCVCVGCWSEKTDKPAPVPSQPKTNAPLVPLEVTHQLPAVIAEDQPDLQITVPVKNATPTEVRFAKLSHSCACSGAKLQKMTLALGEETRLEIKMNLRGRSGQQRIAVTLLEPSGRPWHNLIDFTIYPRARFNTGQESLQLAEAKPKTTLERDVTLEFFDTDRKQLPAAPAFATEGHPFQITVGTPQEEQVAPNIWTRKVPLHIRYTAPDRAGPYHGELVAKFTQRGEKQTLKLGVNGYVLSLFKVTPEFVFFEASSNPDDTCTRKVTIRRTDGKPLEIKKLETSHAKIKALIEPTRNPSIVTLKLTLSSQEMKDHLWGETILHTNQPEQPTLKVQFAAAPAKSS
jgi:hypothetical protein